MKNLKKVKRFSCLDQYLCMAFAQLTYRESLRDIESSLRAQATKLYHLGIRGNVSRNTLANATRDWRRYASFAERLIGIARNVYAEEPFGVDLAQTVYALDATTIDLRGNIPSFIHISDGKMHDVNALDLLRPEPGAYYVMDRGYLDFERRYRLHEACSFFVTRAKSNLKAERRYSHPVDRTTGLICDQTVILSGFYSHKDFPVPLRRIKFIDPKTGKRLVFLTNQFGLPALSRSTFWSPSSRSA